VFSINLQKKSMLALARKDVLFVGEIPYRF
jgi:hypothetical protein